MSYVDYFFLRATGAAYGESGCDAIASFGFLLRPLPPWLGAFTGTTGGFGAGFASSSRTAARDARDDISAAAGRDTVSARGCGRGLRATCALATGSGTGENAVARFASDTRAALEEETGGFGKRDAAAAREAEVRSISH